MKKMKILFLLLFIIPFALLANGSAGIDASFETRYIIDMPNAGVLPKYGYNINARLFRNGGSSLEFHASPFKNFIIGIAYSGNRIVGTGEPDFQGIPGFEMKYRIIDEKLNFPAIAVGARTQGRGGYVRSEERFMTYSPGIYIAVSKNFLWFLGETALHGGINYSFEARPEDRFPNLYAGFEFTVGPFASIIGEFNANLDDKDNNITDQQGLLNAGVRFSLNQNITVDLIFRDILKHQIGSDTPKRALNFEFIGKF
jgi:hypothetical protein